MLFRGVLFPVCSPIVPFSWGSASEVVAPKFEPFFT
jgi:hypothetical protein